MFYLLCGKTALPPGRVGGVAISWHPVLGQDLRGSAITILAPDHLMGNMGNAQVIAE